MRLARLLLQAFGPFTNTMLDFTTGHSNLHLIYGPNEAGKSSALRAMTDLRFGIPLRSPDDFVHLANQLRVGGVFLDDHGEPIGLMRRKGRGTTLSQFDVTTERLDSDLPVLATHELALTGGLERSEFEAMFGLNHARLREGGDLLLKGEGDLGSALFEASAGTRGITALLAALDADAKQIYNPHGRAQNAVINNARRQLDEQRQVWKQAQTKPADWQTLHRTHETAKAALVEVSQVLDALRRRENELTELRTVEPLFREHDRALTELQRFADFPDLPEGAREERLAAEQTLRRAQQDLQSAELELERCAQSLDALVIEPLLLEHAEFIERLAAGIDAAGRSRVEAQQQQAVIDRVEGELKINVARIAPGRDLQEVLSAVPSDADRIALEDHLSELSRIGERLEMSRERAAELEQALSADAEEAPTLPDPVAQQSLVTALHRAQAMGDIKRQKGDSDRQIAEVDRQLAQAMSDLAVESMQALRGAHPLLEAEINRTRQELTEVDEAIRKHRDDDTKLVHDLDEQRLRQRQLAAAGEVITAETLRLARIRRDEGWMLIRQAYVERSRSPEDLTRDFDSGRSLPEAFELVQVEADRQADLLRADAERAAVLEECSGRIAQMEDGRREIDGALAVLATQSQKQRAAWKERLAEAGLPELDVELLGEWQLRREHTLQLDDRVAALRADRDRLLVEVQSAAASIATELKTIGYQVPAVDRADKVEELRGLIEHAVLWEKLATEAGAAHSARAKTARGQRADQLKINTLIAETETQLERHTMALQAWHARLFLPSDTSPESVKSRLDELDGLARQSAALSDAGLRRAQHQAVVDDFVAQAVQLAALLGEPTSIPIDDFVDRLRKRLTTSRECDQQRSILVRDRTRAEEKRRQAEAEREAQAAVLARLCSAANVDAADHLQEREDSAARKRQAQATLSMLRQQLAQASARAEESLRQSLAGQDAITIESERERCRREIQQREQEQGVARQTEEQARRNLEAIDASDRAATAREAMESAAARYRTSVRPWARLRLAHALLQEALNRFRERAQAPMVAAASAYFSLMTGGRYERLVADEADDKPILRAERAGGGKIGVEAMSDGTSDQLYLALRLAALDLRRESHLQMPLVLDDVLITSDDERAANVLRALARFAEGGQVMLFTHHRHLIEVARAAVDGQAIVIHNL